MEISQLEKHSMSTDPDISDSDNARVAEEKCENLIDSDTQVKQDDHDNDMSRLQEKLQDILNTEEALTKELVSNTEEHVYHNEANKIISEFSQPNQNLETDNTITEDISHSSENLKVNNEIPDSISYPSPSNEAENAVSEGVDQSSDSPPANGYDDTADTSNPDEKDAGAEPEQVAQIESTEEPVLEHVESEKLILGPEVLDTSNPEKVQTESSKGLNELSEPDGVVNNMTECSEAFSVSENSKLQNEGERNIFDAFPVKNKPDIQDDQELEHDCSVEKTSAEKQTVSEETECVVNQLTEKNDLSLVDLVEKGSEENKKNSQHGKKTRKPLFKQSPQNLKVDNGRNGKSKFKMEIKAVDEVNILKKAKSKYPFLKELRVALHSEEVKSPVQLLCEDTPQRVSKKSKLRKTKKSVSDEKLSDRKKTKLKNSNNATKLEETVTKTSVNSSSESDSYKPLKKRSRHAIDSGDQLPSVDNKLESNLSVSSSKEVSDRKAKTVELAQGATSNKESSQISHSVMSSPCKVTREKGTSVDRLSKHNTPKSGKDSNDSCAGSENENKESSELSGASKKNTKHSVVKKYPERSCKYRQQTIEQKPVCSTTKVQNSAETNSKPKSMKTENSGSKPQVVSVDNSKLPKKKRKRKVKPWSWGNEKKRSKPKAKIQNVQNEGDTKGTEKQDNSEVVIVPETSSCDDSHSRIEEKSVKSSVESEFASKKDSVNNSEKEVSNSVKNVKSSGGTETAEESEVGAVLQEMQKLEKADKMCKASSRIRNRHKSGTKSESSKTHTNNQDNITNDDTNLTLNNFALESGSHAVDQLDIHDENFANVSPDSGIQSLAGSPAGNESPNYVSLPSDRNSNNVNCTSSLSSLKSTSASLKLSSKEPPIPVSAIGIVSSVLCVTASASVSSFSVTTSLKSSSETATVFSKSVPLSSVTVSSTNHMNQPCSNISSSPASIPSAIPSVISSSNSIKELNSTELAVSPSKKKKRAKFLHMRKASTLLQKGRLPTDEEKEQRLEDKFDYLSKVGANLTSSSVTSNLNEQETAPNATNQSNSASNLPHEIEKHSAAACKNLLDESFEKTNKQFDLCLAEKTVSEVKTKCSQQPNILDVCFSDDSKEEDHEPVEKEAELSTDDNALKESVVEIPDVPKSHVKSKKKKGKRIRSNSRTSQKVKIANTDLESSNNEMCNNKNDTIDNEEGNKCDNTDSLFQNSCQGQSVQEPPVLKDSHNNLETESVNNSKTEETLGEVQSKSSVVSINTEEVDKNCSHEDSQVTAVGHSDDAVPGWETDTETSASETMVEKVPVDLIESKESHTSPAQLDSALSIKGDSRKLNKRERHRSEEGSKKSVEENMTESKNDTESVLNLSENVVPVKRKRGRPPLLGKKKTVIPVKQSYHQRLLSIKKLKTKHVKTARTLKPEQGIIKRGPGRPKGSKNKIKTNIVKIKRSPGRPKGALNKVKRKVDNKEAETVPGGAVFSSTRVFSEIVPKTVASTMMQWRESSVIAGTDNDDKRKHKSGRGPGRPRKNPLPQDKLDTSVERKEHKKHIKHIKHVPKSSASAHVSSSKLSERSVTDSDTSQLFSSNVTKVPSSLKKKHEKDMKMNKFYQPVENLNADGLIFPSRLDGRDLESVSDFGNKDLLHFPSCFDNDTSGYMKNSALQQYMECNRHRRKKNKKKLLYFRSKHKNIIDPVFNAEVELLTDVFPKLSIRGETYIKVRPGEVPRPSIFKMVRIDVKKKKKDKLFVFEKAKPLKSKMDEMKDKLKSGKRLCTLGESFLDTKDSSSSRTYNLPPKKRHKLFSPLGTDVGQDGSFKPEKRKVGRPRKQPLPQGSSLETGSGRSASLLLEVSWCWFLVPTSLTLEVWQ